MRFFTVGVALILVGCAAEVDSRGAVQWPEAQLVLEEELRLDGMEHEFDRVTAVAIAEDGRIAVADGGVLGVRIFGPEGELRATVGRGGEGPGEFTSLRAIGWLADTLWAFDGRQRRYTVFGPELEVARTVTVPTQLRGGSAPMVGLLPDDTVVVSYDDGAFSGFLRMRPDGTPLEEFGRHLASPYRVQHEDVVAPAFFWPQALRALSPDARRAAIVRANVEGSAAETIDVTAVEADTVFVPRVPFKPEPVPSELAEARAAELEAFMRLSSGAAARAREIGAARMYPPVREVLVGRDGSLWLEMRETPEGQPYRSIDADGTPLGILLVAGDDDLAAADRGRVWVLEHDEFDVVSVVQYRARQRGEERPVPLPSREDSGRHQPGLKS